MAKGVGPALALLEVESIARGMLTADAVLKRAAVRLLRAEAVTPGKYLLLFHGGVAEVEESLAAGADVAGPGVLDRLWLPGPHDALVAALERGWNGQAAGGPGGGGSVGIVETFTVASALRALDGALKRADVTLVRLELARGIGGKGVFVLRGELYAVEAALEAAVAAVEPGLLCSVETIASPHPELRGPVL